MYRKTLSYYATLLYRNFSAFTSNRLQQFGLNYGLLFFIVYIGKKPNCTPSELTKELALDWGTVSDALPALSAMGLLQRKKQDVIICST